MTPVTYNKGFLKIKVFLLSAIVHTVCLPLIHLLSPFPLPPLSTPLSSSPLPHLSSSLSLPSPLPSLLSSLPSLLFSLLSSPPSPLFSPPPLHSYNSISNIGAEQLGSALASNHVLQGLSLWKNRIFHSGAEAIANGLASNCTLRWLGVCCVSVVPPTAPCSGSGYVV